MRLIRYLFILTFGLFILTANGCEIEGVNNWLIPFPLSVRDVDRGEIFRAHTTDIEAVISAGHSGENLNWGPYFIQNHQDSEFTISLNDNFELYEEHEDSVQMSISVTFQCSGGSTRLLLFLINVTDTNNNAPTFVPSDGYSFTVTPPLPPGYQLTGCIDNIIARDIDLTNYRIDFAIEENSLFEIDYGNVDSADRRLHYAILQTKAFIRSIPEPIILQISATDVDRTGEPTRTVHATLRVDSDDEFQLPDEPQFTEAFYLASYTNEHNVVLEEVISLQQYDAEVTFRLSGDPNEHFELVPGPSGTLTIGVLNQLPPSIIADQTDIYLVVTAERELTSGASATVIIKLPETRRMSFGEDYYRGTIEGNTLYLDDIELNVGYQSDVEFSLNGDYWAQFSFTNEENLVTISLPEPLVDEIISENNFLILILEATGVNAVSTQCTIILEIIREEEEILMFSQNIYSGNLNGSTLQIESIYLEQGYDDTVVFTLEGAHAEYFIPEDNEGTVSISLNGEIPVDVLEDKTFLAFTINANNDNIKTHATITITLIDDTVIEVLKFENINYLGFIEENTVNLDQIVLTEWRSDNIEFSLHGELSTYFRLNVNDRTITLSKDETASDEAFNDIDLIILELRAIAPEAISAYTTIVLRLDEKAAPVFSQSFYMGQYRVNEELTFDNTIYVEDYDDTAVIILEGEYAQWFNADHNDVDDSVLISLNSEIPSEILDNNLLIVFIMKAIRGNSETESTIIISLLKDDILPIRFEQVSYVGNLEGNIITLQPIIVDEGYSNDIEITIHGELSEYFDYHRTERIITLSNEITIPQEKLEELSIVLELHATAPERLIGHTTIVLRLANSIGPVFSQPYYTGQYSFTQELTFDAIIFLENYDNTEIITLEGENAEWFVPNHIMDENTVTISLRDEIPTEVLENNSILTFTIKASRRSSETISTIIISLPYELPNNLRFEHISYTGTLDDGTIDLADIVLLEGYRPDVEFTLHGDLATHFEVISTDSVITLYKETPIPQETLAGLNFILLELHATAPESVSGYTTIVLRLDHVTNDIRPVFNQPYYTGQYSTEGQFSLDSTIHIENRGDATITLEGVHAQWFDFELSSDDTITIILIGSIPTEVLASNPYVAFSIRASHEAEATIIVSLLVHEFSNHLRFEHISYTGTLEEGAIDLADIVLLEGYRPDVEFTLHGDLATHFEVISTDSVITLYKETPIPQETLAGLNFILLELHATAPESVSGYTTIVLRLDHVTNAIRPVFNQPYYTGQYSTEGQFSLDSTIHIENRGDATITLEGVHAQWFDFELSSDDTITIILIGSIPTEVLASNPYVAFSIRASHEAEATIIVSLLVHEFSNHLRFEHISYTGTLEDGAIDLADIVLLEGYRPDVEFTLHGDLATHFEVISTDSVITLYKETPIPQETLAGLNFILLELHATAPESVSGYITIVLRLDHVTNAIRPVFNQPYYTGQYSTEGQFSLDSTIHIENRGDATITLEGVHAQWFDFELSSDDTITIILIGSIPTEVLASNPYVAFSIRASHEAEATIIVSLLVHDFSNHLRFEHISYTGTLEDGAINLADIVLLEGYRPDVEFTLHGDLATHFEVISTDSVITLYKETPIPQETLAGLNFILLELHATAPESVSGYTTIVLRLDHVRNAIRPVFNQPYYTGQYSTEGQFSLDSTIHIENRGDATITLEGVHAQWFDFELSSDDTITIILIGSIPTEVLASNPYVAFSIRASHEAEATIIVSLLVHEFSNHLRFEHISYTGTLEDGAIDLADIVLLEGYRPDVEFTLHGDLATHFEVISTDSVITLYKETPIPQETLAGLNFILLELHATAPESVSGYTTIVLRLDHVTNAIRPVFNQPYYTGQYSTEGQFSLDSTIHIENRGDATITLEGVHAQWFDFELSSDDTITIILIGSIPTEVLASNPYVAFSIRASHEAEATIIVSLLVHEFSNHLRFEHISYTGTLEDDAIDLADIVLLEGYRPDVEFTLHGDLATHFEVISTDSVITLYKETPIPQETLAGLNFILLELHATAPESVSGYTTIVLRLDHVTNAIRPVFNQPFYTGQYSTEGQFSLDSTIHIENRGDATITLEGVHAQWFDFELSSDDTITIILIGSIPTEVLASNPYVAFSIRASHEAEATIIVSLLVHDFSNHLRFEHISYTGTLEDGAIDLADIVLLEGYRADVEFTLHGDLATHFEVISTDSVITLYKETPIPQETLAGLNFILLELHATAPESVSGYTTIVLRLDHVTNAIRPVFNQPFYTGQYSTEGQFSLDSTIHIENRGDATITLEGVHAQWFDFELSSDDTITIILIGSIPTEVLASNPYVAFSIRASHEAEATIIVSLLLHDFSNHLRFEHISYTGTLEDGAIDLADIVLLEGYRPDVEFTLHGDLATHFEVISTDSVITLYKETPIPQETLAGLNFILLELHATAPESVSGYTTIVLRLDHVTNDIRPVFNQPYYTGQYSTEGQFSLDSTIHIENRGDATITLEGVHAQWFDFELSSDDTITIILIGSIPTEVLASNPYVAFSIRASHEAEATIIVSLLVHEFSNHLRFEHISYTGTLEEGAIDLADIVLLEGYRPDVEFTLNGDLATHFEVISTDSVITLYKETPIPQETLAGLNFILLELHATAPESVSGYTTIVLRLDHVTNAIRPVFNQPYYTGQYSTEGQFSLDSTIHIENRGDATITLEGVHAQWFDFELSSDDTITIILIGSIPTEVLASNPYVAFSIRASNEAEATIIVSLLVHEFSNHLRFEHISYTGTLEDGAIDLADIVLLEGYRPDVEFTLHGDLATHFEVISTDSVITLYKETPIPQETIAGLNFILLELHATAPESVSGYTTIVLRLDHVTNAIRPVFNQPYYTGQYSTEGQFSLDSTIHIENRGDATITLEGVHAQWFDFELSSDDTITIILIGSIPTEVLASNPYVAFSIRASHEAEATIIVSLLVHDFSNHLRFEHISYTGTLEDGAIDLADIVLLEGYRPDVEFTLHGDLATHFEVISTDSVITLYKETPIPQETLAGLNFILLELHATAPESVSGYTTIVLKLDHVTNAIRPVFNQPYYTGHYTIESGLSLDTIINLEHGNGATVTLEGDHSQWFNVQFIPNIITISLNGAIPSEVSSNNLFLVFSIKASHGILETETEAAIIISLLDEVENADVRFNGALFEGLFELGVVQHTPITITGSYADSQVEIIGVYSSLFEGIVSNNDVRVSAREAATIPVDVSYITLELRAISARTALVLAVLHPDSTPPTIVFSPASYVIRVDVTQTGSVGRVHAEADNGETLAYTLQIDNEHLSERLSINSEGELRVSAPLNSGVYQFSVIASTIATQVNAEALVYLTVDVITICGDDLVTPPLIILDRDEEQAHENLVVISEEAVAAGCQYTLTNRWPLNQDWLYVDNTGLHTRIIDREDAAIAFMAQSQIQVQLELRCENNNENTIRAKRSTAAQNRLEWLGPYDYGTNKWILTDNIDYNARRSFVNLIVNDINDNRPIFIGKDSEPIVVGYPVPDILDVVLPHNLVQLKATDADIGENAVIAYWSDSPLLAVARESGSVHVRDNAASSLENGIEITVYATDRDGHPDGNIGSINILVQLLDLRHIAVVTIRNAFEDQEQTILDELSTVLEYEVKSLRTVVVSDQYETEVEEDVSDEETRTNKSGRQDLSGASLQLYVYGMIQREPVEANELISDLENIDGSVLVVSTTSLEQHLESQRSCYQNNGALIGVIVVSVILFIVLVLVGVWFFLQWRKNKNYERFNDNESVASRVESTHSLPKEETLTRPRPNIEEIKRSERRLQDILNTPTSTQQDISSPLNTDTPHVSTVEIPPTDFTIVIQSIDKLKDDPDGSGSEDEFGEVKPKSRRKSVVTFNENVEKIIHVEDSPEDDSSEVYRL